MASLTGVPPGSRVRITSGALPPDARSCSRSRLASLTDSVDLPAPSGPSSATNSPRTSSESRGQVDEAELQAELLLEFLAQQVDADGFGHVVTTEHGVHPVLERFVEQVMLGFPGQES